MNKRLRIIAVITAILLLAGIGSAFAWHADCSTMIPAPVPPGTWNGVGYRIPSNPLGSSSTVAVCYSFLGAVPCDAASQCGGYAVTFTRTATPGATISSHGGVTFPGTLPGLSPTGAEAGTVSNGGVVSGYKVYFNGAPIVGPPAGVGTGGIHTPEKRDGAAAIYCVPVVGTCVRHFTVTAGTAVLVVPLVGSPSVPLCVRTDSSLAPPC